MKIPNTISWIVLQHTSDTKRYRYEEVEYVMMPILSMYLQLETCTHPNQKRLFFVDKINEIGDKRNPRLSGGRRKECNCTRTLSDAKQQDPHHLVNRTIYIGSSLLARSLAVSYYSPA